MFHSIIFIIVKVFDRIIGYIHPLTYAQCLKTIVSSAWLATNSLHAYIAHWQYYHKWRSRVMTQYSGKGLTSDHTASLIRTDVILIVHYIRVYGSKPQSEAKDGSHDSYSDLTSTHQ